MELESVGKSDIGQKREINEDYFYIDNTMGLFIVCDGLGGHSAGEVASHMAIELTIEFLQVHWSIVETAGQDPVGYFRLTQLVEKAIHHTCTRIKSMADEQPQLTGMATTLTLLLLVNGNAIVGHVGDSRLYIKRDDDLFQLTTDHTLLNELKSGYQPVDRSQIQKFGRCLTRSVGNNHSVAVETLMFEARQEDVLLLCTDGLSNYFTNDGDIAQILAGDRVNKIADSLIQFANQCGGNDNITAVVIRVADVDDFKLNTRRIKLESRKRPKAVAARS